MCRDKSKLVGLPNYKKDLAYYEIYLVITRIPIPIRTAMGLPTTEEDIRKYVFEETIDDDATLSAILDIDY